MKYEVVVTREGRWWMVSIPAIDGLTQARRLAEIEDMARSYIALETDVPLSTVELAEVRVIVGRDELAVQIEELDRVKAEAAEAQARAAAQMRTLAKLLSDHDVPTRDIGTVLGVSHQRVSQLMGT